MTTSIQNINFGSTYSKEYFDGDSCEMYANYTTAFKTNSLTKLTKISAMCCNTYKIYTYNDVLLPLPPHLFFESLVLRAAPLVLWVAPLVLRTAPLVLRTASLVLRTASLVLRASSLVLRAASLVLRAAPLVVREAPLALREAPLALREAPLVLWEAPLVLGLKGILHNFKLINQRYRIHKSQLDKMISLSDYI